MTATVRCQSFTSPAARRKGTRPVTDTTHLVHDVTRLPGGQVLSVETGCGRSVLLLGHVDQTRTVSYTPAAARPATCKACTRTPAAR